MNLPGFEILGNVDNLADGHPMKEKGVRFGDLFTKIVDELRHPSFPDPIVNQLMGLTWRLVGNQITPIALMGKIESLFFLFQRTSDIELGMFCIPFNWGELYEQNPVMVMGGVVWASSQARDAFNGKFYPDENIKKTAEEIQARAQGYESQFLHSMKLVRKFEPNEYQQHVMKKFPNGLPLELNYQGKQFHDAS